MHSVRRLVALILSIGLLMLGLAVIDAPLAVGAEIAPPAGALIVNNASSTDPAAQPAACATATYPTIQAADTAASAGATIYVCAGLYDESVTIDKNLTFDGAQLGVDARTGRTNAADETIVATSNPAAPDFEYVLPAATGTIDGFTISGVNSGGTNGYGIQADYNFGGGYHWINNILTDSFLAIHFETSTNPAQTIIQHDLIENSPEDIWSSGSGTVANNVLIDSNAFRDNGGNDVHWDGANDPAVKATGLVVTNNTSTDDAAFALLIDTDGAKIENNTITWTGGPAIVAAGIDRVDAIGIAADNTGTLVSNNTIIGADLTANDPYYWDQFGIAIASSYGSGAPPTNITVTDNTLVDQVFGVAIRNASSTTSNGYVVSNNTITSPKIAMGEGCTIDANGYLAGGVGIIVFDHNSLPGVTAATTIQNQSFSITGNTVTDPQCKGIWVENVDPTSVNIAGTVSGNTLSGAAVYDCQDQTAGSRTAGTDNTWTGNIGTLSSPIGLCDVTSSNSDATDGESGGTPAGQLSYTGAPIEPLLFASLLLLLTGTMLQSASRHRGQRTAAKH